MPRTALSPPIRYALIVGGFVGAAVLFDWIFLQTLAVEIAELALGRAQARATAEVLILVVLSGGGLAGLVATAPLVGRELADRDRSLQVVLYFLCAIVVPGVWWGGGVLFWLLGFIITLSVLGAFLYVERRVRGERLPAPTRPNDDHACPACGSLQVDLAPRIVDSPGPTELLCFSCDHRWHVA